VFAEVDKLDTVIAIPAGEEAGHPELWESLCGRLSLAFVVPADAVMQWKAWASRHPSILILNRDEQQYLNPVAGLIRATLEHFNAQPHSTAIITHSPGDLPLAANCRVGTILLDAHASLPSVLPDLQFTNTRGAVQGIHAITQSDGRCGRLAEVAAVYWPGGGKIKVQMQEYMIDIGEGLPQVRYYPMGRYFASEDARHGIHPLTARIVRSKERRDPVLEKVMSQDVV